MSHNFAFKMQFCDVFIKVKHNDSMYTNIHLTLGTYMIFPKDMLQPN